MTIKMENVKVIDGENAILGRLASYVAKQALKGENIVILNCEKIIITGNKANIKEKYLQMKRRVGTIQKGPKVSLSVDKLVKRTIRGMLPEHRWGRGRDSMKRIRCYIGTPAEYSNVKKIVAGKEKTNKYIIIKEISKI